MVLVYGLCDPDTRDIFYVGLTSRHWSTRLSQHCSDPTSAAHGRIAEIRNRGGYPICIVFGHFNTVDEARVFERDMISLIDGPLLNRYGFRVEPVDGVSYHPFDDGWGTLDTLLGGDLMERAKRRRVRRLRERADEDED